MGRYRVIRDRLDDEPYLERYYVFLKDRETFPFNVFVHKFLKSDPDDVHDHPWPFATLILRGGYWEWRPTFDAEGRKNGEVSRWCGAGSFRTARANTYHPDANNVIGDSWSRTNGYSGNNISNKGKQHELV